MFIERQVSLPMQYEEITVDVGYRLDLLVEKKVVIELKSVEFVTNVHHKQLLTYLKLSGYKLGLLVNFNTDNIADNIFRKAYRLDL
ncbi:hypothetical protein GCM10007422_19440 [Pedobacter zeae]|uniref:GxxExxY protein n=2 Tax=Pedobacter zeae TaxID=1737356 RepID=A0ABQ1XV53_9SPHI|nr:hypothetical protein GCM10007422_19440 [Pedobacter zeae]